MWMVDMNKVYIFLAVIFCSSLTAEDCNSVNPKVYFISPADGYVSKSQNVKLVFGIDNFNILPAGINGCNSGHHHLIVDADLPILTRPIPSTENYIHFGKGQTEFEISLSPGKHTLQLLLGDYAHIPHRNPIFSNKITIKILYSE